jgi:hypothetical protein
MSTYDLRYPLVGEPTGLVEQQRPVYIGHHFALVYAEDPLMPSAGLGFGLAELRFIAGYRQQSQSRENGCQNQLI